MVLGWSVFLLNSLHHRPWETVLGQWFQREFTATELSKHSHPVDALKTYRDLQGIPRQPLLLNGSEPISWL